MAVDIVDVESTADDGMTFSVVLTLDAGVARTVKLQLGYETGGATVYLQENNVQLQQGAHTFDFTFGEVTAERLVAQIAPVNWLIGPGPLTATASLPDDWENEPLSNSKSAPFPQVMLPKNDTLPLFQTVREKVNGSPA